jgi:hypothetical protein
MAPTFGLRRATGKAGIAAGLFRPYYYVGEERVEAVENGRLVTCLACGNQFGVDHEGVFLLPQPQQAQPPAPPPQASRPRLVPRPEPETPPSDPRLIDDDMVDAPSME